MSEKTDDETNVMKIKKFDGNHENFVEWFSNFVHVLTMKDLEDTLEKEFNDQLPAREDGAGSDADKKAAVRKNKKAHATMMLSITCLSLKAKIENLSTDEWGTPKMWEVVEFLRKECRPVDRISKAQQKGKLMEIRPCEGEDPDKYLSAVLKIEMDAGVKFDEEEKIAQALIALGPEYGEKMNDKAKTLEEKGETVTFVELMEGAKEKWRVSGKGARMKQEAPVESSLTDANLGSNADVANTGGRHANKTCYHCGRTGHIKIDCPEWIQFKRNMKNAVCGYPGCGQKGHTTARCWEDPANAKHRPPGWVSRISKLDTGVCEVFV